MPKSKQKIKLSENLKMGVSGPSSQNTFFKVGGVFFLILSLVLGFNILRQIEKPSSSSGKDNPTKAQVLGAFDNRSGQVSLSTTSYTVQKGDTLFNIAQAQNVSWQVIATLNNLNEPYTLKPGVKLKLPQK